MPNFEEYGCVGQISLKELKKPFQKDFIEYEKTFKTILSSNVQLIDTIVNYVVKHKGKGLRPLLVIMAAKLVGKPTQDTYVVASVVELLHSASLVHDDVVDDSFIRRGFPSINAMWKNKIAVLMGDYMLSKCLIAAASTDNIRIMQILAEASKRLSKGELSQIEKSRRLNICETEYYEIVSDKTAALISSAAELGAMSSSKNIDDHERLRKFGEYLGIAFQIKDDLLDYFGHQHIIGKPVGNDFKEKKITLPLIYAFKQATAKEISVIKKSLKKGVSKKEVDHIIQFVKDKGGIQYAEEKKEEYARRAKDALAIYPETDIKQAIKNFVDYTIQRKK